MTPKRQFVTIALALSLAGGLVALFHARGASETYDRNAADRTSSKSVAQVGTTSPASPATVTAPAPAQAVEYSSVGRLASERAKFRDLRAYVEMVKQRPKEGGYFMAFEVAGLCVSFRDFANEARRSGLAARIASTNDPSFAERIATLERMEEACRSFTPEELASLTSIASLRDGVRKGDVTFTYMNVYSDRLGHDKKLAEAERLQAIRYLLSTKNPYTLETYPRALSEIPATMKLDAEHYLDGKRNGDGSLDAYFAAWELVGCTYAGLCGKQTDPHVMLACVKDGVCAADRFGLLKAQLPAKDYADTMRIYARLIEVVQTKDAAALMPPAGVARRPRF